MISNARGKHSSPGVYIEEIDKTYATKSLGITTLGVVGETLRGPAFEPISISDWAEFQEYFGGTSTEKFKGTEYPKYELPYIAKSYLQESKQLEVCRVLGLSGYDAGPAWAICGCEAAESGNTATTATVIGVLRSKGTYSPLPTTGTTCSAAADTNDNLSFLVSAITASATTVVNGSVTGCSSASIGSDSDEGSSTISVSPSGGYGIMDLHITYAGQTGTTNVVSVSLDPTHKNYIVDVLGMSPDKGDYPIYVEELYDMAHMNAVDTSAYTEIQLFQIGNDAASTASTATTNIRNYKEMYRYASTPWFVSEIKGTGTNVDIKKLFRFHTISDGNAANTLFKVSIMNILPDEGLFDVVIRDFNDVDNSPVILERFSKCSMMPGTPNYIGLKIGTFNGEYALKSKYVTVEVIENEMTETCVPCGFLGYPMRTYSSADNTTLTSIDLAYNTLYDDELKINRQYFGLSDLAGIDSDVLMYKGKNSYNETQLPDYGYSNGFHLDAYLNSNIDGNGDGNGNASITVTVDGVSGYTFTTVDPSTGYELIADLATKDLPHIASEEDMKHNIYSDKRLRKFTCCFYGGFDGWDVHRDERTNGDVFRANKYKGTLMSDTKWDRPFSTLKKEADALGLSGKVINSDYYAYLAGYKQFINPHKVKINLLATPGIDYVNNPSLVNEVLDIVEEYRQGDCLYIVTTPDKPKGAGDGADEMYSAQEAVDNFMDSEINTSYAATYYPWVKYYDATNRKYINLPATKDVVRNFAHTDNVSQPWFASAGMSRGSVDCVKAHSFTKLEDEDTLYEGMINPVKSFGGDGVKLWGNKTMYLIDSPLNRINVRRLMIRIKDLISTASMQLIFEQNDNTVEAQFRSLIEPILNNAKQNRGISDFKIKTDTSAEARDRHELPAKIWIKPINCLEFISLSFVVTPEGASFEE